MPKLITRLLSLIQILIQVHLLQTAVRIWDKATHRLLILHIRPNLSPFISMLPIPSVPLSTALEQVMTLPSKCSTKDTCTPNCPIHLSPLALLCLHNPLKTSPNLLCIPKINRLTFIKTSAPYLIPPLLRLLYSLQAAAPLRLHYWGVQREIVQLLICRRHHTPLFQTLAAAKAMDVFCRLYLS